jgi:hypothetical protein
MTKVNSSRIFTSPSMLLFPNVQGHDIARRCVEGGGLGGASRPRAQRGVVEVDGVGDVVDEGEVEARAGIGRDGVAR